MSYGNELTFARIASQVFGAPLLLAEAQGLILGNYLASRMSGAALPEPQGNRFKGEDVFEDRGQGPEWQGFARIGSTARIGLMGELVNRGAWLGSYSGLTSYEGFSEQLDRALSDRSIETILLDVNTPGGAAHGMLETARSIKAASQKKRVIAMVNTMAASAGYGLVSGASEIVMTESSEVGSIGVLLMHFDRSKQLEAQGVQATILHAGQRKVDGHPFGPLEGDAKTALEARINGIMDKFVGLVADHRGIDPDAVRQLEAAILPADEAIAAGLADRVGTFDGVLSDLNRADHRISSQKRGFSMSTPENEPTASGSAITQGQLEKAVADATAEGAKTGRAAERERIGAIIGSEEAKGREQLASHFAFKTEMDPDAALAALAASASAAPEKSETFADRKSGAASADFDLGSPAKGEKKASGLSAAVDRQISAMRR